MIKELIEQQASTSTCTRRKVGAVIVDSKGQVISTGVNGIVDKARHLVTLGCLKDINNAPSGFGYSFCKGIHAEQAALSKASRDGISCVDGAIYVTFYPCSGCAKSIIAAGITEVYYYNDYNQNKDNLSELLLDASGISVVRIESLEE